MDVTVIGEIEDIETFAVGRRIQERRRLRTRGHRTHSLPAIWSKHPAEFMTKLTPAT